MSYIFRRFTPYKANVSHAEMMQNERVLAKKIGFAE
jgi:hypothetical protein